MNNIKSFVNGFVTGNGANTPANDKATIRSVPTPDKAVVPRYNFTRNRTESESSNASTSSNNGQKDKDSYFWVM